MNIPSYREVSGGGSRVKKRPGHIRSIPRASASVRVSTRACPPPGRWPRTASHPAQGPVLVCQGGGKPQHPQGSISQAFLFRTELHYSPNQAALVLLKVSFLLPLHLIQHLPHLLPGVPGAHRGGMRHLAAPSISPLPQGKPRRGAEVCSRKSRAAPVRTWTSPARPGNTPSARGPAPAGSCLRESGRTQLWGPSGAASWLLRGVGCDFGDALPFQPPSSLVPPYVSPRTPKPGVLLRGLVPLGAALPPGSICLRPKSPRKATAR